MRQTILTLFIAASLVLFAGGCGKDEQPEAPQPPADTQPAPAPQTAPATRPTPTPPAPPTTQSATDTSEPTTHPATQPDTAPGDDAFQQMFDRALELEADARFSDALDVAREIQQEFPARAGDRVRQLSYRLKEERREAMGLSYAVEQLGSDQPAAVEVATGKLTDAGEVGRIFLRKAVRDAAEPVTAQAARVLVDLNDSQAPSLIVGRLEKRPGAELAGVLTGLLKGIPEQVNPELTARLIALAESAGDNQALVVDLLVSLLDSQIAEVERIELAVAEARKQAAEAAKAKEAAEGEEGEKTDDAADAELAAATTQPTTLPTTQPGPLAGIIDPQLPPALLRMGRNASGDARSRAVEGLVMLLDRRCEREPGPFDEAVDSETGYWFLRHHLADALEADTWQRRVWAASQAGPLDLLVEGILGDYYGEDPDTLIFERLDSQLSFAKGQFGYPEQRADNLRIHWRGFLVVPEDGEYTFSYQADDTARAWVDERPASGEDAAPVTLQLDAGMHELRIEYVETTEDEQLVAWWQPPDGNRQVLGGEALQAPDEPQLLVLELMKGPSPEEAAAYAERMKTMLERFRPVVLNELIALAGEDGPSQHPAADVLVAVLEKRIADKQIGKELPGPDVAAEIYRLARRSDGALQRTLAGGLYAMLEQYASFKAEPYNKAVGAEDAYAWIREFVSRTLWSTDEDAVAWARPKAAALGFVVVDARTDDTPWKSAPVLGFADNLHTKVPQTTLRAARDQRAIYFAYVRQAPTKDGEPVPFVAAHSASDDAECWLDDEMELFITDAARQKGLQLGVSAGGGRFDALSEIPSGEWADQAWDGRWRYAVETTEQNIIIEVAVPFETLREVGINPDTLAMNAMSQNLSGVGEKLIYLATPAENVSFGKTQRFRPIQWHDAADGQLEADGVVFRQVKALAEPTTQPAPQPATAPAAE